MARAQRHANTDKILSRRIMVLIKRDQTASTPRIIWAHEFPVLEEIHGEGNVEQLKAETLDEGYNAKAAASILPFNKKQDQIKRPSETAGLDFVFTGDARTEYERMAAVYGKHAEANVSNVEHVYGRFQAGTFERALGIADYSDMPDAQLRQLIVETGYLPVLGADADAAERKELESKRTELNAMPTDKLVALIEELAGALA